MTAAIDYVERPGTGRAGWRVRAFFYYGWFLFLSLMSCGAMWGLLAFWVPRFREIFKDFKTTLPTPTEYLMTVSDWAREPMGMVVGVILLLLIPVLPAVLVALPQERWKRVGSAIFVTLMFVVGGMILFMCMQFILQLPLMKLVQSVSGGEEGGG